ncbi:MAG TPA: peptide-binding protein [Cyanobacteria bacterium UBA12227]|nr:peptide-binding protein [Cyanobacteria bacterium UBA12227]HAX90378.1 peptide-binding protein [Cyanobacteria bacterium UBA11370]
MSISGIFKFLIGFVLGIFILAAGGVAAGYYFYTKLSVNPPRPLFAEEQKPESPTVDQRTSSSTTSKSSPANKPSPSPTPSESPEEKELPPGAYKARVSWSEGLSLRDAPGLEANRIGGVAYNQEIIILKESDDKRWQQVRVVDGDQEGWIKAGNIERINE